eukprot:gene68130-93336_t
MSIDHPLLARVNQIVIDRPRRRLQGAHPPHQGTRQQRRIQRQACDGRPEVPREAGAGRDRAEGARTDQLALVEIELKALELTQLRVVADEGKHGKGKPNPASSVLKIKGSEIQQATTELLMEVIGPFAAPYDEHGDDGSNETMDWTAQIAPSYFNNRKVSIYGGSNEIQRNIITKAVLGLGRIAAMRSIARS